MECNKSAENLASLTKDQIDFQQMSGEIEKILREIGSSMENTIRYESLVTTIIEGELGTGVGAEWQNAMRERINNDFADLNMNAKERTDALVRLFGMRRLLEIGPKISEVHDLISGEIRSIIVSLVKFEDELTEEPEDKRRVLQLEHFLKIMSRLVFSMVTDYESAKKLQTTIAERISWDMDIIPIHVSAAFSTELITKIFDSYHQAKFSTDDLARWITLPPTNDFQTADHPVKLAINALNLRENDPLKYLNGGYGALARTVGYERYSK